MKELRFAKAWGGFRVGDKPRILEADEPLAAGAIDPVRAEKLVKDGILSAPKSSKRGEEVANG